MKRYRITHHTQYTFSNAVELRAHTLRLRPREDHELRIETSTLNISPKAVLRWHRDVEGNSVCIANFSNSTTLLTIESDILIQQYNLAPLDFLVSDYAVDYPFFYSADEQPLLAPYMSNKVAVNTPLLDAFVGNLLQLGSRTQTVALLLELNQRLHQSIGYRVREEEGVQSAEQTLALASGSCRDSANLFMAVAKRLGLAARFVSGYLSTDSPAGQPGATHAWAEVFIPGAGWKGFDPSSGIIAGPQHIAVAVARIPESVPPISGAFIGPATASMTVKVWVNHVP